jgi:hypothetical protein
VLKQLVLAGAVVSGTVLAPVGAAHAATTASKCVITIKGKTWVSGPCKYEDLGDGSFMLSDPKMVIGCDVNNDNKRDASDDCAVAEEKMFKKGVFVYVNIIEPGKADGSWNEGQYLHAQTNLGTLTRKGACWSNKTAKICAYK